MESRLFRVASRVQAHLSFYLLKVPYQEATEESKGRHIPALELKQGPDMAKKPKTQGARKRASKTLQLPPQPLQPTTERSSAGVSCGNCTTHLKTVCKKDVVTLSPLRYGTMSQRHDKPSK